MSYTTHQPLVSVIILNYNGKKWLKNCLDSVFQSIYESFEVIFVDNASADNSINYVQENWRNEKRLRIIKSKENIGFAKGNNLGAKYAYGKYLVLLNNDTQVNADWLLELVNVMESDRSIGAAQSKLLQMDSNLFDSAGDYLSPYGAPFQASAGQPDNGQYPDVREIFSARGAAMIIRSSLYQKVGGFDPNFGLQLEDLDLSWRVRLYGYKVVLVPKSIVFHKGGASLKKVCANQTVFMYQKNRLMMLLKNYSTVNIIRFLVPVSFLMVLTGFFFEKECIASRLKAFFWVIINFGKVWRQRIVIQNNIRIVKDSEILRLMYRAGPLGLMHQIKRKD